jgi:hypothetical protein
VGGRGKNTQVFIVFGNAHKTLKEKKCFLNISQTFSRNFDEILFGGYKITSPEKTFNCCLFLKVGAFLFLQKELFLTIFRPSFDHIFRNT